MKKISTILLSFVLLLSACAKAQPTWQEQYDLGVRYLEEGNYEKAIIAFTAAIEIDPKQAEAYVGRGDAYVGYAQTLTEGGTPDGDALEAYENAVKDYRTAIRHDKTDASVYQKAAEIYILLEDTDSAIELLEKGLRATEDQSLQDFLDELAGVVTASELTEGSDEWQALEMFLSCFGWYGPYDAQTAVLPDENWSLNALEKLLTVASCYSYEDTRYPGEELLIEWDGTDPLGKWEWGHGRASADKMDWLLEHIFNCSPEDISSMKEPIMTGKNEEIYYLDGYYYFMVGGIGGGYGAEVTRVEPMGKRYYVEYNLYDFYVEEPERWCASMSLKNIAGKEYWSLYNCQKLENVEQNDQQPQISEDEAYKIAQEYWHYTPGTIAEETGYEIFMNCMGTYPGSNGTDYYYFNLQWLVDGDTEWGHLSVLDTIYINMETGKIVLDAFQL